MMCVPNAQGRSCDSGYLEVVFYGETNYISKDHRENDDELCISNICTANITKLVAAPMFTC